MKTLKLLSVKVDLESEANILEKISLYIAHPSSFFHIISLNPEILVQAYHYPDFANVLSESDIQLCDGVGVLLGCSILGIPAQKRISGVDFMETVLNHFQNSSLRVLIIGGRSDLAEKLAKCYENKYPSSNFKGLKGFQDIKHPTELELEQVNTIVADYKPQIIFAAFGSPEQEMWFWNNRDQFKGIVCMGVGGGLDFAVGAVSRAPKWIRNIGMEWLYRLILQPWRWKRQLRLVEFIFLVIKQKLGFLQ